MLEKGLMNWKYDERLLLVDPLLLTEMELLLVRLLRFITNGGYHINGKEIEIVQNYYNSLPNFINIHYRSSNL